MIVQLLQLTSAFRSRCRVGSAVATIVWSTEAMSSASETIAKINQRLGAGSSGARTGGTARGTVTARPTIRTACWSTVTPTTVHCLPAGNYLSSADPAGDPGG